MTLLIANVNVASGELGNSTCCPSKFHNDDLYILKDDASGEAASMGCKDNCVYEKHGEEGSRFCFKEDGKFVAYCAAELSFKSTFCGNDLVDYLNGHAHHTYKIRCCNDSSGDQFCTGNDCHDIHNSC